MLFQNLLAASFALVSRKIAKQIKNAHFQVVAVIFIVILICGWVYGFAAGGVEFIYLGQYFGWFVIAGIAFGLTNVGTYKVLEYVDAGIATIFSTLNTIAAVLFATILIQEGLSLQEIFGATILLGAIWFIMALNVKKSEKNRWFIGLMLSIFAAICFGFATTIEKYLLNNMPMPTYISLGWSFQALAAISCSLLFNPGVWKKLIKSKVFKTVIFAGVLRAFGGFLFIASLVLANNLSLISVLSGVKAIFVVFLAAVFLKEKKYFSRKLEGALIAAVGIAIMLW